jgi:hypothetical protein
MYSKLLSTSRGCYLSATWRRAMEWWQWPTDPIRRQKTSADRTVSPSASLSFSSDTMLASKSVKQTTNCTEQVVPETLTFPKTCPTFYGARGLHFVFHINAPLIPIMNQINPVHNLLISFLKVSFNITLSLMFSCSKWSHFFTFSHQNYVCIFSLPYTMHKNPPPRPPSED